MKLMQIKNTIIVLLVLYLSLFVIRSVKAKTYIIGVENIEYLPYSSYKRNTYTGYNRALFDMFATYKGYTFVYKALPVKRVLKHLIRSEVDFKYPDNALWQKTERENSRFYYSNAVVKYLDGFMVLLANKNSTAEQLPTLSIINGFTPWEGFSLENDQHLSRNLTVKGILGQVLKKRIDGAYLNVSVALYQLDNTMMKAKSLVFNKNLPHSTGEYVLSSISYPEIIDEFNAFLLTHKTSITALKVKFNINVEELLDD